MIVPKSKRLRVILWLGILILGVGIGGWLARPKPILQALDPLPPGYFVVDAEEIERKPLFDFRLPIIGHWRFPRWVGAPPDFNGQVSAGLLALDGSTTNEVTTLAASWEIEGHRISFETTDRTPIVCPRVYGDRPVIAKLRLGERPPIRIRLPAIGGPSPKARSHTIPIEEGTLTCTPEPLLSPQFPIRYALHYRGKPTFVSIRPQDPASLYFQAFPVWSGMKGRYLEVDPKKVRGQQLVILHLPSAVHKFRVKLGPVFSPLKTGAMVLPNLELVSLDGIYRADGIVGERNGQRLVQFFNLTDKTGALGDNVLQVDEIYLGATTSTLRVPQKMDPLLSPFPSWRNGQIIEARVFTTMNGYESWETEFPAELGALEKP